ncbi:MAG: hypothetical protein R3E83_12755 [Burkholderiaceae bacterium]
MPIFRPSAATTMLSGLILATLTGCAAPGERIASIEPPDGTYLDLDCAQVASERTRVMSMMDGLGARLESGTMANRAALGAGVVFWPALFMVDADEPTREHYARAKGRYERLAWQWQRRDCDSRPMTTAESATNADPMR